MLDVDSLGFNVKVDISSSPPPLSIELYLDLPVVVLVHARSDTLGPK